MRRFEGADSYVATPDLRVAVNAAIALERPLLVKGDPAPGKTILAHEIARGIGKELITWLIKSTTKAQQGLYGYDAVVRLRDGQLADYGGSLPAADYGITATGITVSRSHSGVGAIL
jgi:MoxR-like ATPase